MSAETTLTRGTLNPSAAHGQDTSNITTLHLQPAAKAVTAEDMINEDCPPIIIDDDQSFQEIS